MNEPPTSRCGYTWPEDYDRDGTPHHQNCCYRKALPDADFCVWHADPRTTNEKTIDRLETATASDEVRKQNSPVGELIDGARLSGIELRKISFEGIALRDSDLSNAGLGGVNFSEALLSGADLSNAFLPGADLSGATLVDGDISDAHLPNVDLSDTYLERADLSSADLSDADLPKSFLVNANLSGADLTNADLSDGVFSDADLSGTKLTEADLSSAELVGADLSDADLTDADLPDVRLSNATLSEAGLSGSDLTDAILTNAALSHADLTHAILSNAVLTGSDLSGANLWSANLSDGDVQNADLSDAYLASVDLTSANLSGTDLSDVYLEDADLTGSDLEHAVLVRTNLFNVNLTDSKFHGATFTDVQINDGTIIQSREDLSWWQKGPLAPLPRCRYDPYNIDSKCREEGGASDETNGVSPSDSKYGKLTQLGKAADVYQTFEMIARENARPSLQSAMFLLRQDMQRKRYWLQGQYFKWSFARISRTMFKHGESLGRIFSWAILIITGYAALYVRLDLITDADGTYVINPVDALYFSTLTFTTLGLGDFQPDPSSQFARLLVTSQAALGAILIAIFVFVLGRRAAR